MKEINWAMVLSFIVPGAGQIGRLRLLPGYFWFVAFYLTIYLGLYYSKFWFIISIIIHFFNVLDAGEILTKNILDAGKSVGETPKLSRQK